MQLRKVTAASAAVLALALTATACGSEDKDDAAGSDGGGKITIGIKIDQPGLGLKTPDGKFAGFDVDIATYVAKELGYDAKNIEFVETKSADRETAIERGDVKFIAATYSINDERLQKVDFAGPYLLAHQDVLVRADDNSIKSPEDLNSKNLCSVTGSTSAKNVKDKLAPKGQAAELRRLLRVPHRPGEQGCRRSDHGRLHPRRIRGAGRPQGQVQAGRLQDDQRELRHRPEEGRRRPQEEDRRRADQDGLGRLLGQGGRGQLRSGQLQERARAEDRQRRQVALPSQSGPKPG